MQTTKQPAKPKVYVLMLSKYYPEWHSCKGNKTHFYDKVMAGVKLNTYRVCSENWKNKAFEVYNENAVISVRQWSGKPYASKQIELFKLGHNTKFNFCVIKKNDEYADKFTISTTKVLDDIPEISALTDCERLAREDGLTERQFCEWFFRKSDQVECIKISFNDIIKE